MNRKAKQIFAVLAAVAFLCLFWLLRSRSSSFEPIEKQLKTAEVAESDAMKRPAFKSNAEILKTGQAVSQKPVADIQAQLEQKKRDMLAYTSLWRTSLLFYGKVIDESNQPIPGVQISYGGNSANESLTEEAYNKGTVITDERGIFKIDGIHGIGLMFQVHHSNYYSHPDNSTGFDVRSPPKDGIIPDSEATARVFRMHHKGRPVALITRRGGLHKSTDGATMDFPLRGKTQTDIIGQLKVQGWKGEPDPQSGHYDWKVKVSVPDGGVLESTDEFAFVAPDTGYQQTLEISESKDDPNWKANTDRTFFFKLPNHFARGRANIDLFHDLYFSMEYLVNPNGSANLEDDSSR